jgi:hypothetical protein
LTFSYDKISIGGPLGADGAAAGEEGRGGDNGDGALALPTLAGRPPELPLGGFKPLLAPPPADPAYITYQKFMTEN